MREKKFWLGILVMLVFGMLVVGCGDEDSPPTVDDFYGFWEGTDLSLFDISEDRIRWGRDSSIVRYDLVAAVVAININELTRTEFPSGFTFVSDGGVKTLYLSTNKTRFIEFEDIIDYLPRYYISSSSTIDFSLFTEGFFKDIWW
jgi:hypothetical protein